MALAASVNGDPTACPFVGVLTSMLAEGFPAGSVGSGDGAGEGDGDGEGVGDGEEVGDGEGVEDGEEVGSEEPPSGGVGVFVGGAPDDVPGALEVAAANDFKAGPEHPASRTTSAPTSESAQRLCFSRVTIHSLSVVEFAENRYAMKASGSTKCQILCLRTSPDQLTATTWQVAG